jgi:tRNA-2-methylthio-N6-dimethylallyladenosine synthase
MRFYLETFGCQMNQYDSGVASALLEGAGHLRASDPGQAEAYLVNSCSVREHAEEKLMGRLCELAAWKRARPGRVLGLLGCVAQRLGERALARAPHLDLVAGTECYGRLPALLERASSGEAVVDVGEEEFGFWNTECEMRNAKDESQNLSAFVAVSRGCDNRCTYCIVPYVRGPERCRPVQTVLEEVRSLVARGVKEVVLLGQNVNSYQGDGRGSQGGPAGFAQLLGLVDEVPGIVRIGFLTSHPKDLSEEILTAMAESRHIAHHLHLPLQSGSDRILGAMNRKYTFASYQGLVRRAREMMPNLRLTTDLITGFPGESEEDFQATLHAVQELRFDEAFTFRFSEREGTPAAVLPATVPVPVRKERLARLIALVSAMATEEAARQAGRPAEVLVEGPSRKDPRAWKGRTRENREVIFERNGHRPGDLARVSIRGASGRVLLGAIESETHHP